MYACVVMDIFFSILTPIQKKSQKADEYIRMIKDQLPIAVEQCIEAAGSEYEPATQRMLLRVSQWFGEGFFFSFLFLNFIPCSWLYQAGGSEYNTGFQRYFGSCFYVECPSLFFQK